jgi:hypothetical protein
LDDDGLIVWATSVDDFNVDEVQPEERSKRDNDDDKDGDDFVVNVGAEMSEAERDEIRARILSDVDADRMDGTFT